MPLDTSKMKSYLSTVEPRPGRKLPVAQSAPAAKAGKASIDIAAYREALLCGDDVDDAAIQRLASKEVNYMEIAGKASGFSCGSCTSYDSGEGACSNEKVMACVSDEHGCCNLFWPADESDVTFPPMG
jgi:hypothetical protein